MGLSDIVHGVLDVAGFIPVVGAAADIANAAVYAAEGDWGNAALSAVSAIPVVGDAAAVAGKSVKVIAKVSKASENALSNAEKMKSLSCAMKGKAETGAKKVSNKDSRKCKEEEQKTEAKQVCTEGKCFTGDTLVYTVQGLRPIKEIKKGDDIYSRNIQTGETAVRKVEEVFQTEAHTIYHIWLDGKEELKMTAYHPVFVKEQGWINAIKLREGNVLETLEGMAQVTRIKKVRHEEPVEVFNFHVEEWESYFVSERQVYVHNGHGHGNGNEIVYPPEKTYEAARNTLLKKTDETGAFKNGSDPYIGRLKSSYGCNKIIGRQSYDGRVRWRLDFDKKYGVHINFEDFSKGKKEASKKIVIPIEITHDEYKKIIDLWN